MHTLHLEIKQFFSHSNIYLQRSSIALFISFYDVVQIAFTIYVIIKQPDRIVFG